MMAGKQPIDKEDVTFGGKVKQLFRMKGSGSSIKTGSGGASTRPAIKKFLLTSEIIRDLSAPTAVTVRLKTIRDLTEILLSKSLEERGVEVVWACTSDLIDTSAEINREERCSVLRLLITLIRTQFDQLEAMRLKFFLFIKQLTSFDDLNIRLELLQELTLNGKNVDNFEEDIGEFLLELMDDVMKYSHKDTPSSTSSHTSSVTDGSTSNRTLACQFMILLVNVIKSNSTYLDEEIVSCIVSTTCEMICSTNNDEHINVYMSLFDAVIAFYYLPSSCLQKFLYTLCLVVSHTQATPHTTQVTPLTTPTDTVAHTAWKLVKKLVGTHLGYRTIHSLSIMIQTGCRDEAFGGGDRVVKCLVVRGAVLYTSSCLWGSDKVTTLRYPHTAVLPAFLHGLKECDSWLVTHEILLSVRRLVSKHFDTLLPVSWDLILDIIDLSLHLIQSTIHTSSSKSPLTNQIQPESKKSELQRNQSEVTGHKSSVESTNQRVDERESLLRGVDDLLSEIERVYVLGRDYSGSVERLFDLIEQCASRRSDESLILLIEYRARDLVPTEREWLVRLNGLIDRFYRHETRRAVRVKVVGVMGEVLRRYKSLYEDELIDSVLIPCVQSLANERDAQVKEVTLKLVLSQAALCFTDRFHTLLTLLQTLMLRPLLHHSSGIGGQTEVGGAEAGVSKSLLTDEGSTKTGGNAGGGVEGGLGFVHTDQQTHRANESSADIETSAEAKRAAVVLDVQQKQLGGASAARLDVIGAEIVINGLIDIFRKRIQSNEAPHQAFSIYSILLDVSRQVTSKDHLISCVNIRKSLAFFLLSIRADVDGYVGVVIYPEKPLTQVTSASQNIIYSRYITCAAIGQQVKGCGELIGRQILLYSEAFAVIRCYLEEENEWAVLEIILTLLPALLQNKTLLSTVEWADLELTAARLCKMLGDRKLPECLHGCKGVMSKSDFHSFLFPVLTSLVSFHFMLKKNIQVELVRCLEFGLISRCARMCVRALSVCALEMRSTMTSQLPSVLRKLSQISANNSMAIPLMEFLSSLVHLQDLYRNFVEEQYKFVFAVALPYTNPYRYSHYVVSLAYSVISMWFIRCRVSLRKSFVRYIVKGLRSNVLRQIEEQKQQQQQQQLQLSLLNQDSAERNRTQSLNEEALRRDVPDIIIFDEEMDVKPRLNDIVSGDNVNRKAGLLKSREAALQSSTAVTSSMAAVPDLTVAAEFHKELTETCIDMLARYAYLTTSSLPRRSQLAEFLLKGGQVERWLQGNCIVTVTTSGGGKVSKKGLCERCSQVARSAAMEREWEGLETSDEMIDRKRHRSAAVGMGGALHADLIPLVPTVSKDDIQLHKPRTVRSSTRPENPVDHMQAMDDVLIGLKKAQPKDQSLFSSISACNCWCTQWAELSIRRPTGHLSWVMRIQNNENLIDMFPDLADLTDISSLFLPVTDPSQIDQGETRGERKRKKIDSMSLDEKKYSTMMEEYFLGSDLRKMEFNDEDSDSDDDADGQDKDTPAVSSETTTTTTATAVSAAATHTAESMEETAAECSKQVSSAGEISDTAKVSGAGKASGAEEISSAGEMLDAGKVSGAAVVSSAAETTSTTELSGAGEMKVDKVEVEPEGCEICEMSEGTHATAPDVCSVVEESGRENKSSICADTRNTDIIKGKTPTADQDSLAQGAGGITQAAVPIKQTRRRASAGDSPVMSHTILTNESDSSSLQPILATGTTAEVRRRHRIGGGEEAGFSQRPRSGILTSVSEESKDWMDMNRASMTSFGGNQGNVAETGQIFRHHSFSARPVAGLRGIGAAQEIGALPGALSATRQEGQALPGAVARPQEGQGEAQQSVFKGGVSPSYLFLQMFSSQCLNSSQHERPLSIPDTDSMKNSLYLLDLIFPFDTHKIGVLYVKPGQAGNEKAILSNMHGPPRYMSFLHSLGRLLELSQCDPLTTYLGGLDRNGADGKFAYAWHTDLMQVIFHVVTLMPYTEDDEHYVEKKKHIGNDYVCIVYDCSEQGFNMGTIRGQFNYVNIIIRPLDCGTNEITVQTKPEIEDMIGHTDTKIISDNNLASLVRQMAVHADLAATIHVRQKLHPLNPYASNSLERLRRIRQIRERASSSNTDTHQGGATQNTDFTDFIQ